MVIDISQFHDVFFEESFEGLDIMQSELLELKPGAADPDSINIIFRAVHSLKGGAGTFGFTAISELTGILESMLNDMRNGQKDITAEAVELLLESVGLLRGMLTAIKHKAPADDVLRADIQNRLTLMMAAETDDVLESDNLNDDSSAATQAVGGWEIYFKPHPHLFQTGNDPVRMLRELATLGEFSSEVLDEKLPPFSDLEPEDSYLAWQLTLKGDIPKEEVLEIFEWVDEDCDFTIQALAVEVSEPVEESMLDEPEVTELTSEAELPEQTVSNDEAVADAPLPELSLQTVDTVADGTNGKTAPTASSSIRLGPDKVNSLMDLVGELVITQSMLSQLADNFSPEMLPDLIDGLAQLERNTRDMQEGISGIRMLPIHTAFNHFPTLIKDLADKTGKKVELRLTGEQTEVDKSIMDKIGAPLALLVRNALDHGLETPNVRLASGKSETGSLEVKAFHQGGNLIIEVHDDGAGLDEQKIFSKAVEKGLLSANVELSVDKIHKLIFLPGFSTDDVLADESEHGMDVVRNNIESLNGVIDVQSTKGEGTTFTICVPLPFAIIDGQTVSVANEKYILPLVSIIETLEINETDIKHVTGKGELYTLRDKYIPIIRLYDVFNLKPVISDLADGLVVVVEARGQQIGLFIDDLLGQQQVVIKRLEDNYRKVQGLSGATVLGDGSVTLILDVAGLLALYRDPSLAMHNERAA